MREAGRRAGALPRICRRLCFRSRAVRSTVPPQVRPPRPLPTSRSPLSCRPSAESVAFFSFRPAGPAQLNRPSASRSMPWGSRSFSRDGRCRRREPGSSCQATNSLPPNQTRPSSFWVRDRPSSSSEAVQRPSKPARAGVGRRSRRALCRSRRSESLSKGRLFLPPAGSRPLLPSAVTVPRMLFRNTSRSLPRLVMAAWADSMPRRTGMRSKSLDSLLPWTLSRRRSMSKVGMSVGPPIAQRPLRRPS